jgi:SAM-dependent methyltransferase
MSEVRSSVVVSTWLLLLPLAGPPGVLADDERPDESSGHGHEAAPIDCPLRKAGIDPHGMRPFEDVAKYIEFLEREDRSEWQRPDDVVNALRLEGDETVADLGAGSGYFTFRLAEALPDGEVVAIDVEPEMVRHLHHKVTENGISNVRVVLATADDPEVPPDADLVFVCDVLHHVHGRQAWLRNIASTMKEGARLVLVEFKEGDLPNGPPAALKISKRSMIDLATASGLALDREMPDLLPYQTFLVFRKP